MSPQLYGERNQLFYFFFFYDANCSSPVRQLRAGQLQSWHVSGWKTYLRCSWPAPGLYKVTFFTIVSSPTRVVRSVLDALLKRLQCRYEVLRSKHGTLRAGEIQVSLSDGKYFKYLGYFKIEKHKVRIG